MDQQPGQGRQPLTLSRRRLGQLGILCFGVGAATSAVLTLSPRHSFSRDMAGTVTPPLGLLVQPLQDAGPQVFPESRLTGQLCRSVPDSAPAVATVAQTPGDRPVDTLMQPALRDLETILTAELIPPLAAVPWPQIHDLARTARVPVLMYHDVLETKEVFFDVTVAELQEQFAQIEASGATPISLAQLIDHLRRGTALPPKPVLLTFDDGYEGHYTHVYPLLQDYQYPAVFSLFPGKLDGEVTGRSTLTWEQAQEMAADPLVTIAAHSVTHPPDLRALDDEALHHEVVASKARLEEKLGITIRYFTYPAGHYDDRVAAAVAAAGYEAALTMSNEEEWFAGESESLLAIGRFGQSQLSAALADAWEGLALPRVPPDTFDFASPIRLLRDLDTEAVPLALVTGGRPVTVHADSRYQVNEILARTNAIAAVDGGFFSLKYLDSNVMIGPVLSQATRKFVPGNASENPRLNGRPLALISPDAVKFVPFRADQHNTLAGLQAEMPTVTDAFVGAAWLVRDGIPQTADTFGTLFDFDAHRHRAFWGINLAGQPVIGVSKGRVDSETLGQLLHEVGLRDAIMLDSGASTSLAYRDELLVGYVPRPVPHIIALLPQEQATGPCPLVFDPLTHTSRIASRED